MHSYTIYDLCMNITPSGEKFILPIKGNNYIVILNSTLDLFRPYIKIDNKIIKIDVKEGIIEIPCLYEVYDGYPKTDIQYYSYKIVLKVFHLKYDNQNRLYDEENTEIQNGQLMIALSIESHELLNELIDIILSNLVEKTGLKKYNISS